MRPALEVADIFRAHGPAWRDAAARPPEPGSAQGHVGHRAVPQRGAGRACAALCRLRHNADRLQLLSQPPLPEVPGAAPRSAGSRRARPICCRSSTTTSCSRCRRRSRAHRLPEQGGDLRAVVRGRRRRRCCTHRRRSEASRRAHRRHAGAAHLGLGADASSACAWHRARRRHRCRRRNDGSRAGRDSSCRCACSRACSGAASSKNSFAAHAAGRLRFFGEHAALADAATFARWLAPLRRTEWVVYAKRPFAGPAAVLAYLSRYTHRVAIANSRLLDHRRARRHLPLEGLSGQGQAPATRR